MYSNIIIHIISNIYKSPNIENVAKLLTILNADDVYHNDSTISDAVKLIKESPNEKIFIGKNYILFYMILVYPLFDLESMYY